jgi:uncharacterized membrane protein YvlD (DUF360 family)
MISWLFAWLFSWFVCMLITALTLFALAMVLPGIKVKNFSGALGFAIANSIATCIILGLFWWITWIFLVRMVLSALLFYGFSKVFSGVEFKNWQTGVIAFVLTTLAAVVCQRVF